MYCCCVYIFILILYTVCSYLFCLYVMMDWPRALSCVVVQPLLPVEEIQPTRYHIVSSDTCRSVIQLQWETPKGQSSAQPTLLDSSPIVRQLNSTTLPLSGRCQFLPLRSFTVHNRCFATSLSSSGSYDPFFLSLSIWANNILRSRLSSRWRALRLQHRHMSVTSVTDKSMSNYEGP